MNGEGTAGNSKDTGICEALKWDNGTWLRAHVSRDFGVPKKVLEFPSTAIPGYGITKNLTKPNLYINKGDIAKQT